MRSADVRGVAPDPGEYDGWSCNRLRAEDERVQRQATRVAYAFDERTGDNIVAMGVGVSIFWPALLAMRSAGSEARLLADLKGRHDLLSQRLAAAACPPPDPEAELATAGLALHDRLDYEQRERARGPAVRWSVELAGMAGGRAEWRPLAPEVPPAGSWVHDRQGNLLQAPQGIVWPELLRGELTLGEFLHGELVDLADSATRARVRGQVMAVGPQDIAGRRFDAAVIELFGDVPAGDARSRLDGVMVLDRSSGLLLRLDLESSHPSFRLQRRLMRVEPPPR